uniref:Signal peptide peptidase-like 2A n=1 Tax=Panagrolaimus sp. JU765 TaxID=591449 RepID=A0AC34RKQ1_9BILA
MNRLRFVILLICIAQAAAAYDSYFAFAQVRNPISQVSSRFCVNHQFPGSLPSAPDLADPVKLVWFSMINDTNICPQKSISNFTDRVIVPIRYTTFSNATCLGAYSTSTYMDEQARWLSRFGVDKVLYLVEKGKSVEVAPKYHKYLFSQFSNPELNETNPDTFYIYWDTFFDEILKMSGSTTGELTPLEISFYRPKSWPFDFSEAIIVIIAVFCIVAGSVWSTRILTDDDMKLSRVCETSSANAEEGALTDSPTDGSVDGNKDMHVDGNKDMQSISVLGVAVIVGLIFAILIMAFFFRVAAVWLFNIFVVLVGTYSIYKCLMALYCFEESKKLSLSLICCNLLDYSFFKKKFGLFNVFAFVFAAAFCISWFIVRKQYYAFWLLNFINLCLCVCAMHGSQIRNLKIISILLIGMFIYDIVMVFGTRLITPNGCSVMLQVVTGVDCNPKIVEGPSYPIAPVEMSRPERMPLLFYVPFVNDVMQSCYDVNVETEYRHIMLGLGDVIIPGYLITEYRHIMLGLGDVIIPGYLIVYCFFVDKMKSSKIPYGVIAVIGYIFGLISTFLALKLMKTAQPALIYLVPFTLIPIILTSIIRGHFQQIWRGKFTSET